MISLYLLFSTHAESELFSERNRTAGRRSSSRPVAGSSCLGISKASDRLEKPAVERRELKSIFTPKSARVLRVLFRDPRLTWRVTELAEAAGVSLGHVSNVRTALRDREWAEIVPEGFRLKSPDALLDAWKAVYEPPLSLTLRFYTTLHWPEFDRRARAGCASVPQ